MIEDHIFKSPVDQCIDFKQPVFTTKQRRPRREKNINRPCSLSILVLFLSSWFDFLEGARLKLARNE
jgi:hypothetical protein